MSKKSFADRVADAKAIDRHDEVERAIDQDTLTPLVRQVLNNPHTEVVDWQCHRVKGGIGGNQLVKLTGSAQIQTDTHPWSLFLKILRQESATQDLSEFGWKREAMAYQSGILDNLAGGIEAAICYLLDEKSDKEIWMWLEDLSGEADAPWSVERYGLAARHIGQLNGFYLNEPSLPNYPWQLNAWERQAVARDGSIDNFNQTKDHPIMQKMYPADTHPVIFHLWEERETYLNKLFDQLPQTFGHMDAFRTNLFSRTSDDNVTSTIAIDWAFIGTGAIGKEIKLLVFHSLFFDGAHIDKTQELDQVTFTGYLDGLQDMGWTGDPRLARYGYVMTAAMSMLRFSGLGSIWLDESKHALIEEVTGRPFEEMLNHQIRLAAFSMQLIEEGIALDKELF